MIHVLGLDPSINPHNFGFAAMTDGRLAFYGVMEYDPDPGEVVASPLAEIYLACRELAATPWYRAAADTLLLAVDYPFMFSFASDLPSPRGGGWRQPGGVHRGPRHNLNSLARNHQAIGAALAAFNLPDNRIVLYTSSSHRDVSKVLNWQRVCAGFKLDPAQVPEHIADAIKIADDVSNKARLSPALLVTLARLKSSTSTKELMG